PAIVARFDFFMSSAKYSAAACVLDDVRTYACWSRSLLPEIGDAVRAGTGESGRGSYRYVERSNRYPAICSAVSPNPPPLCRKSTMRASTLFTDAIARLVVS